MTLAETKHLIRSGYVFIAMILLAYPAAAQECAVTHSDTSQINLAVAVYEPWMIVNQKGVNGIDVDIVREIAKRMNIKVNMIECNWTDCLKRSRTGSVDLLTNLFRTPEREAFLSFLEPPYLIGTTRAFYALGDDKYKVANYDDLQGIEIGIENDVLQFSRFDSDKTLSKSTFESSQLVIKALLNEDVDVIVGQENVFDYIINNSAEFSELITKQRFSVYAEEDGYFGVSKCNDKDAFWQHFEKQLITVINEGFVNKVINNYR
ncbi:transporter substrate-binding domain-containing protein [Glaciecola sp. MH2013]|uniref:substrate-binding periplasmic protein n=1 Tax=Glaciecola sp. MH2013 TaxID=2785524 RepID=UPI00189E6229|nr:transporter substrate-binding domain-containing protein [Glaciecola sp. MH2013]MBF7073056.1 transporter substrate-binding domain-containing protein [Glaciecola sp. MH2013]